MKEHVETCDVGLTCDIIDESFYKPIIIAPTNPSCSTSTSTSSSSDGFTCDDSLMVESETLNKEVKALKQALDELKATHERLKEAYEKLGKAHKSLKKLIPLCLLRKIKRSMLRLVM